jgi:hypothetical protein
LDKLSPKEQSYLVRSYVLKHFGGIFIELDSIVFADLTPIWLLTEIKEFVGYYHSSGSASIKFFASQAEGEIINILYDRIYQAVEQKVELRYNVVSSYLTSAIVENPSSSHMFTYEPFEEIKWYQTRELCEPSESILEPSPSYKRFCLMLSYSLMKEIDQTQILYYIPEDALIAHKYYSISKILREALEIKSKNSRALVPSYLGGHKFRTNFDVEAFKFLVNLLQVNSIIDVGCGPGGTVFLALSMGLDAVGIDGDKNLTDCHQTMFYHDYTKGPLYFEREYDLGWSVEFLEHVEETYISNYMSTLAACRFVLVTAAGPGQEGHHHVNCQSETYWLEIFRQYGFEHDEKITSIIRGKSSMRSNFVRKTGLFFRRIDKSGV